MAISDLTLTDSDVVAGQKIPAASVQTRIDEIESWADEVRLQAIDNASDQNVGGTKTFTSIPVLPASNPTTDNQAARKAYVDGKETTLTTLINGYVRRALYAYKVTDGNAGVSLNPSSDWTQIVLNENVHVGTGYNNLSTGVITLGAGTYIVRATAAASGMGEVQLRLRNTTDSSTEVIGTRGITNANADYGGSINLEGIFTLADTKDLELQIRGVQSGYLGPNTAYTWSEDFYVATLDLQKITT